ncbi:hypothetical protein [Spirillospora sp. NPDC048823]|uniref:hypothetical protein n=1 Tax=unclassified Spirillospora TaxID=2642701 RepID=UPI00371B5500
MVAATSHAWTTRSTKWKLIARAAGKAPPEFAVSGPPVRGLVLGYGAVTAPEIGEGFRRFRRFVGAR